MARLERLDEDRAILGREPAAKNQRAVLVPVPVEIGALLRGGGFFGRHPPVGPHGSFELGGGQLQREAQEILLGLWLGDPGQRPDLGVGELPGRESGANRRELAQPARDPNVLPGRSRRQPAAPGEPLRGRARDQLVASIDLCHQLEPAAHAGVYVRRESGQLLDKLVELELGDLLVFFTDNGHVGRLANVPDDTLRQFGTDAVSEALLLSE